MFCCACAGSCNHVGAHSYCDLHRGNQSIWPPATWTYTSYPQSLSDADVERVAQRVVELLEAAGLTKKRKKR